MASRRNQQSLRERVLAAHIKTSKEISKMSEENNTSPSAEEISKAASIILPTVEALTIAAEKSGAKGDAKHEAVSRAVEILYRGLQKSIKELRVVPWETIEPIVVGVGVGMISAVVELFNSLFGKLWGRLSAWVSRDD